MKKLLFFFIVCVFLFYGCVTRVAFIGTMSNKPPEEIGQAMKFTKPDGAFQIAQFGDNQYLFLRSNPDIESTDDKSKVYTRKQLVEMYSNTMKPNLIEKTLYFEEGKYRIVRMVGDGTPYDFFRLFEEFDSVKNANNLKFSIYHSGNNFIYLFSYKK